MKFAICDDCRADAEALAEIIKSNDGCHGTELFIYEKPSDLISALDEGNVFDAYFLDIDMPEIDGLSLAGKINNSTDHAIIVFFTSFPEYAVEAFECDAFHYLLKPLTKDKVNKVLSKILRKYKEKNRYIVIKNRFESKRVNVSDIYYVETYKKHLIYYLKDETIESPGKLSDVYELLRPHGFYQVHQGFIVNLDKIKRFDKSCAVLDDGRSVMISTRRRGEVLIAYAKFVEGGSL